MSGIEGLICVDFIGQLADLLEAESDVLLEPVPLVRWPSTHHHISISILPIVLESCYELVGVAPAMRIVIVKCV